LDLNGSDLNGDLGDVNVARADAGKLSPRS
jgi:hypothetical protein